MLLSATGIEKTVEFRGEQIPVKRGQFITSEPKLSKQWGWSRDKVRYFLRDQQVNHTIEVEISYKRFTKITILNYATYNPLPTTDHTTESKKSYKRKNITNKDNINKDKERYKYNEIDIHLSHLLFGKILENNPKSKIQDMDENQLKRWYNECRLMRERDRRTPEEIEAVINWSLDHHFWKSNIRSMEKLRIQFDRLWEQAQEEDQFSEIKKWLKESKDPF